MRWFPSGALVPARVGGAHLVVPGLSVGEDVGVLVETPGRDGVQRRHRVRRAGAVDAVLRGTAGWLPCQAGVGSIDRLEEQRRARYDIRAPFDGTVISILSEAGAMLSETDRILGLAQLDPLEARLNLPVELFGQLTIGQRYTLLADEPINGELVGTLKTVSPIIDTASQTFLCVFTIENPEGRLPAGFTVYLRKGPHLR